MSEEEFLRQPTGQGSGRKSMHPLTALFGAMRTPTEQGVQYVTDRGGIFSDLWERYPEPWEVTNGEVIACFDAAGLAGRVNSEWCDEWSSSIKSKKREKSP